MEDAHFMDQLLLRIFKRIPRKLTALLLFVLKERHPFQGFLHPKEGFLKIRIDGLNSGFHQPRKGFTLKKVTVLLRHGFRWWDRNVYKQEGLCRGEESEDPFPFEPLQPTCREWIIRQTDPIAVIRGNPGLFPGGRECFRVRKACLDGFL